MTRNFSSGPIARTSLSNQSRSRQSITGYRAELAYCWAQKHSISAAAGFRATLSFSSYTRRLFPSPASPPINVMWPCPSTAPCHCRTRSCSSWSRPARGVSAARAIVWKRLRAVLAFRTCQHRTLRPPSGNSSSCPNSKYPATCGFVASAISTSFVPARCASARASSKTPLVSATESDVAMPTRIWNPDCPRPNTPASARPAPTASAAGLSSASG